MAQPYKVSGESPVDFILAGLKGAVVGYAGGQAARKQAEQMLFENKLKLDQLQIQKDQMKQQWDMWQEDTNNRWKELLQTQKFTETQAKMNQGFQKEMYKMQLGADISMKVADWNIENHKNKMNMAWDIFKTNLQDANEKKKIGIQEQAQANETARLKSDEDWKRMNYNLDVGRLDISKEGLKLSALGMISDIYSKAEQEKRVGALKYGEVTEADINGADARVQAAMKTHIDKKTKNKKASAMAYSNATLMYAKLMKQKTGDLSTMVVVPKIDTTAQSWTGKDNPNYGKPVLDGSLESMSLEKYLNTRASQVEKQVWFSDNPYAAINLLQADKTQQDKATKGEGVSGGNKNILDELMGIAGVAKPAEATASTTQKMYPMKTAVKNATTTTVPISKEAQDYIDYVKPKGYKSVSELPEEDINELKSRGMYEDVAKGLSPKSIIPTTTRKMTAAEQKAGQFRNRIANVFSENRISLDMLKELIDTYGESEVRKGLESYTKTHKTISSVDQLIKMAR